MQNPQVARMVALTIASALIVGCIAGEKELSYLGDRNLDYYKDVATSIQYPAVADETPEEVVFSHEPHRLRNRSKDEPWDMTLQEAIELAVQNSEIIRNNAEFLSPSNRLLLNPDFVASVYDPAIQSSNVLYGQRGAEAALAEFDSLFTTNMTWGRSEQISVGPDIGFTGGETRIEEFGDFRAALQKQFASGGQLRLTHNWFYSGLNSQFIGGRMFPSHFTSRPGSGQDPGLPTFGIEYRHPLWAGAGTEFTRIAGPINSRTTIQNVPAVNQGVVIARIRTDISLADFEAAVLNLIRDVENVYWDLYLAYRTYDAEVVARNSALQTWREVKSKLDQGLPGGSAADEAQARDNYFETRARAEQALSNIYTTETRLRRLLGLPVNDGKIIRPVTEPVTAEFNPDWRTCLVEALTRRVELRRQKWNIKSLELQLKAARSLTYPRLDFVSRYQINGFGDKLFGSNSPAEPFKSAYDRLFHGDETGWGLGFEFSLPIGFRAAHAQVRNVELRLAKARAALAAQELEISHELAAALQQLDQAYVTAQTNFNRMRAAQRRVQAFEAEYKTGRTTLDLLLRAQISLAQAEIAYFSSLVQYNQALNELRYRKGTLLEDDNIYLAESLSDPQAYVQALRRAWARSYAFDAPHLLTEPEEFASDVPYEVHLPVVTRPGPANSDKSPTEGPPAQQKQQPGETKGKEKPVPKPKDLIPPAPAPPKGKPKGVQAKVTPPSARRTASSSQRKQPPPFPSSAPESAARPPESKEKRQPPPFPVARKVGRVDSAQSGRKTEVSPIPDARRESPSVKRR
ncbi:MAG: TolC family protein [Planctomycetes bacterium]|nr:TolC family protein [Planctomycetota bacterium]